MSAANTDLMESSREPLEPCCHICGCTEANACLVNGVPCAWIIPGELCDNPACLAEIERRMATDEGEGVEGESGEPLVGLYTDGDLNQVLRERRQAYGS